MIGLVDIGVTVQLYYTGTSMRPISLESPFYADYNHIFSFYYKRAQL